MLQPKHGHNMKLPSFPAPKYDQRSAESPKFVEYKKNPIQLKFPQLWLMGRLAFSWRPCGHIPPQGSKHPLGWGASHPKIGTITKIICKGLGPYLADLPLPPDYAEYPHNHIMDASGSKTSGCTIVWSILNVSPAGLISNVVVLNVCR